MKGSEDAKGQGKGGTSDGGGVRSESPTEGHVAGKAPRPKTRRPKSALKATPVTQKAKLKVKKKVISGGKG